MQVREHVGFGNAEAARKAAQFGKGVGVVLLMEGALPAEVVRCIGVNQTFGPRALDTRHGCGADGRQTINPEALGLGTATSLGVA